MPTRNIIAVVSRQTHKGIEVLVPDDCDYAGHLSEKSDFEPVDMAYEMICTCFDFTPAASSLQLDWGSGTTLVVFDLYPEDVKRARNGNWMAVANLPGLEDPSGVVATMVAAAQSF